MNTLDDIKRALYDISHELRHNTKAIDALTKAFHKLEAVIEELKEKINA